MFQSKLDISPIYPRLVWPKRRLERLGRSPDWNAHIYREYASALLERLLHAQVSWWLRPLCCGITGLCLRRTAAAEYERQCKTCIHAAQPTALSRFDASGRLIGQAAIALMCVSRLALIDLHPPARCHPALSATLPLSAHHTAERKAYS